MNGMVQSETAVIGGAGNVGAGIVAALLDAGMRVLVIGRDATKLDALRAEHGNSPLLDTLQGSVADDTSAQALATELAQRPHPLAAVIASLGSPLKAGRLLDRPVTALRRRLERDVLPHLAAARHLLPLLSEAGGGGRYLLLGSPLRAWAAHGDISIAAAATRMLAQVLHEEAKPLGVRVHLLSIEQPVCTPGRAKDACPEWIRAVDVGRAAVSLIVGPGQPGQPVVTVSRRLHAAPSADRLAGLHFPIPTREISP
ncbi:SDR family NAD(P)-dependent oxidoreductase [Xanthomonas hortorum]|uniref:SDR family NAD(P)-dependent oxidoreductase n=1 Tax=Xanthomonas hortorum pv. hederae TaxID=453603 RepID=A0A9X3Z0V1_9XANT|nr:SDR family NAD(P)-dependent oxidoreductase [Xanthomonas hortorum]MCE4371018.1 SDR family NAD(P)-dependent oxidoreductase [Xanthomonas hortorum pv. hederae]MDC8637972.1 SDR family NAD(P)-dependent oxidoreductase [Xanthomonas hortorum pv. hederae]PPU79286.1 aklaviketone reductase [Xanthomonas hortorum pv. hederae]PUF00517.1 SDR family NAD(P)-dependent oxidoreductase [Xanthomonas hortorum pv. hederae]